MANAVMAKREPRESRIRSIPATQLRVAQLAQRWNVAQPTIYRWIEEGKLGHLRVGRVILIDLAEIERFEAKRYVAPTDGLP